MISGTGAFARGAPAEYEAVAPLADKPPVLAVRDLSVVYQTKRGPVGALDELNLAIRPGEFVSVVGPSGCGKSTFLNIAAGLVKPTQGVVEVNGAPVSGPRRNIGVVFQKPNLFPWKTVLSNATINARVLGMDPTAYVQRAQDLLRIVGLESFMRNYPWELSGGMQQRVGLVRALVPDPEILLMDEPFAALDAMTREQMSAELQRLWLGSRKSVIFITHSISEAVFLSDRILVMSARPGRIVDEMIINITRPRGLQTMATPEFAELCDRLRRRFASPAAATSS